MPFSTGSISAQLVPLQGSFTNRSGTIATGGTSQVLAEANANRVRLVIENPVSSTTQGIASAESLFINFSTVAATTGIGCIELSPGGSYDTGSGPVSTEAVNVTAATAGHIFLAKEMIG